MVRPYLQRSVRSIKNIPSANGGSRFVKSGFLPMVCDTKHLKFTVHVEWIEQIGVRIWIFLSESTITTSRSTYVLSEGETSLRTLLPSGVPLVCWKLVMDALVSFFFLSTHVYPDLSCRGLRIGAMSTFSDDGAMVVSFVRSTMRSTSVVVLQRSISVLVSLVHLSQRY